MITIHCCLTLNMNSHIMTCPPYNHSLISIIRLRDPRASRRGNALRQKPWLRPALFISGGMWGWDRGGWRMGLSPPPPETCSANPRDRWTRRSRQPRQSSSRGHFARRGCGRRRCCLLWYSGALRPARDRSPSSYPSPIRSRENLGWGRVSRLPFR